MKALEAPGTCCVCTYRAYYEHDGRAYCSRNACQLVAAGLSTPEQARASLRPVRR